MKYLTFHITIPILFFTRLSVKIVSNWFRPLLYGNIPLYIFDRKTPIFEYLFKLTWYYFHHEVRFEKQVDFTHAHIGQCYDTICKWSRNREYYQKMCSEKLRNIMWKSDKCVIWILVLILGVEPTGLLYLIVIWLFTLICIII